jgi:outer membrane protein OmpA-like peptidoglycan-associated protein
MKLRSALLAATVMGAPIAAMAQPVTGLYVGAGAGFNYQTETKVKALSFGTIQAHGGNLASSGGFVGVGSVGYGLGNGLRVEVEGDYRNDHSHLRGAYTVPAGVKVGGGGDVQSYGVMVNALFDFDPGLGFVFPYVGVGVGYDFVGINKGTAFTALGRTLDLTDNTKGSLAAQAILGAAVPIAAIPGLSLTLEYRFHDDTDSEGFRGKVPVVGGTLAGREKIGSLQDHAALIGFRYAFNAAPPPPPMAPPVVPVIQGAIARTYLVFFDWDRSDLTARARQIVADAAKNSTAVQSTKIQVSGHADRSGTPQYNQGLSLRRAETVAAELVRDGVPRAAISIQAFGDTRPLVPTAAGVREPQNRRVEIVLQ